MNRIERLNRISEQATKLLGELDAEKITLKPSPDRWSIAEIFQHIIQVNESYYATFDRVIDGSYHVAWTGNWAWFTEFIGNSILKSVMPENRKKSKTMPIWTPSAKTNENTLNLAERFVTHLQTLKRYLEKLQPFADEGLVISSPANKYVVYRLETALEIIVTHAERHLQQANELADELASR